MTRICIAALSTSLVALALACSNAMAGTAGALDADFGVEGVTKLAYYKDHSPSVIGMVSLPSGRTIIAVNRDRNEPRAKNRELLFGINSRGKLDESFGVNGVVVVANGAAMLDFTRSRTGDLLVLEADSRLRALNPDGVAVPTFGTAGVLDLGISGRNCSPMGVAVQSSGRIILAGSNGGVPCVVGITSTGEVDETFGELGVQTFSDARVPSQKSPGLAVTSSDSIFVGVVGRPHPTNPGELIRESGVVKFTPNGALDTSYGILGLASLKYADPSNYRSTKGVNEIIETADGGTLLSVAEGLDYGCTRGCGYTSNGYYLDAAGRSSRPVKNLNAATDFSAAPNGRVVVSQNNYFQPVISRWTSPPALESEFINYIAPAGLPTTEAVEVDRSGRALIGGTLNIRGKYYPFENEVFVARFLGSDEGTSMPQIEMDGYAWERMDASNRLSLVGTARPANEMRAIEIAVERTNSSLRKRRICQWIRSTKGGYVTRKLSKGRCPNPVFIRAKGTEDWKLNMARGMRWGRHNIYAKAVFRSRKAKPIQTKKDLIWDFSVVKRKKG